MRIAATAAVFGGVVLVALAGGQPPAKDATPKAAVPAAKLIADLGSDDYRTRENAGKGLAALGEKALPEMRKALDATDDPEVSRRLAVLVRKLDHDRLVSPKRVTLAMKDKPVQAYLDEITKQTGYRIEYGGGPGGEAKLAFEFDNAPFWVAIDHIANAAGLNVYADSYDDSSIRMYSQDAQNPHVAYAGPFRFVATQISSNKNVQLSGLSRRGANASGRGNESVTLNFQIQSEPKNPILGTTMSEVIAATDDTGASLVPPKDANNSRSHYYNNNYRTHNAYANLQLVKLDKTATAIKTLKAKVGVILLANTVPEVVVPDPLKAKAKKYVGRTVEMDFDSLTEANGNYTVTVTLKKLGASDDGNPDYNWSNNLQQKMELYDDKGNKFRNNGATSINNNGAAVAITVQFSPDETGGGRPVRRFGGPPAPPVAVGPAAKPGAPSRFVFNEWVSVTHEVTFEFKDIPLP